MLQSGSLLIMSGATQQMFEHRLPRRLRNDHGRGCTMRINATFRRFCYLPPQKEGSDRFNTGGDDSHHHRHPGAGSGGSGSGATDSEAGGGDEASCESEGGSDSDSDSDGDDDAEDDAAGRRACRGGGALHRFAARPVTSRLFAGHGHKKLGPGGEQALAELFRPLLTPFLPAVSARVALEASHRGYAFANLPPQLSAEQIVGILAALDGQVLDLHANGACKPLNLCPATDPVCKHWAASGKCLHGDQCKFRHETAACGLPKLEV
jgi:hypothetical protein